MNRKLKQAAEILESRRWTFSGETWQEPRDAHGNSVLDIADTMADLLEAHFQVHAEHAAKGDKYSRAVAAQLAPVLASWQKLRLPTTH